MEQWVIDILKISPQWGAVVAIVWMSYRSIERIWTRGNQTTESLAKQFQESVKEIGEKCHVAHHAVATMYHQQSGELQKATIAYTRQVAELAVHISHLGDAIRDRNQ